MKVPEGYERYKGEYNKQWYHVLCNDGRYLYWCWPNAGAFRDEKGVGVDGSAVFAVKPLEESPWV